VDRQESLKWLPHARDPAPGEGGLPACLLAQTPARLAALLDREVRPRLAAAGAGSGPSAPHLLAVLEPDPAGPPLLLEELLDCAPAAGVTVLWLADTLAGEPSELPARVLLDGHGAAVLQETAPGGRRIDAIAADAAGVAVCEAIARRLAPLRLGRRAQLAATAVRDIDQDLAAALSSARGTEPRLPTLVYAAEDLTAGITHDGPRAFSRAHFGHTKARDDATDILAAAGIRDASLFALGLRRSPYLGLGGPVVIHTRDTGLELSLLDGPILLRADQRRQPALATTADVLLVVENLQAAESACDAFPHVAVVWTAGQPADAALGLMASLAYEVEQLVIVPDADLGGVRIAQRVLTALPIHASTAIIDVGQQPHPTREPFGPASLAGLRSALNGPAANLAAACLTRGYPVEQEAATRAAIAATLRAE
jgi:hypothetical protein